MARQRAADAKAAFGRIGMAPVPPPVTSPEPDPVPPAPGLPPVRDVTTPRRHDAAPAAVTAVAFTVRFEPEEAYEDDAEVLSLRRELGWRKLDKSVVIRGLLRLLRRHADVRRLLLDELRRTGS